MFLAHFLVDKLTSTSETAPGMFPYAHVIYSPDQYSYNL